MQARDVCKVGVLVECILQEFDGHVGQRCRSRAGVQGLGGEAEVGECARALEGGVLLVPEPKTWEGQAQPQQKFDHEH